MKRKEKLDLKQPEKDNSKSNKKIYAGNKKKQSDYLKLFLPISNNDINGKFTFNSYSKDKKNRG